MIHPDLCTICNETYQLKYCLSMYIQNQFQWKMHNNMHKCHCPLSFETLVITYTEHRVTKAFSTSRSSYHVVNLTRLV